MLAHSQDEQARSCEWCHSDKRYRDTDENRQETNPAGDGANCFHELPLSTVNFVAFPARACKDAPASREIQAYANGRGPEADQVSFLRPSPKPKKAYPNSDRFEEDGRRIYSAYDAATVASPRRKMWAKRIRIAAIVIAVIAVVLAAIVISVLPH
ncbi:hypothetical protein [Mesorhizobium sp. 128a]